MGNFDFGRISHKRGIPDKIRLCRCKARLNDCQGLEVEVSPIIDRNAVVCQTRQPLENRK